MLPCNYRATSSDYKIGKVPDGWEGVNLQIFFGIKHDLTF